MRLPKVTRKVIYAAAAKGRSAEITWPAKGPEPKRGHRYTLQSSSAAGENMLVVEAVRELPSGYRVIVRLTDQIRALRTGAVRPIEAKPFGGPQFRSEPEPEQVDTRHQELITAEGRIKTIIHGAKQRGEQVAAADLAELERRQSRGKPATFQQAKVERAGKRLNGF